LEADDENTDTTFVRKEKLVVGLTTKMKKNKEIVTKNTMKNSSVNGVLQ
jgi:hypothetical protein